MNNVLSRRSPLQTLVPSAPSSGHAAAENHLKASAMDTHAISVRGVSKSFGPVEVLHNIDLDIEAGQVTCLIGPSGSGKSTLLRCMAFLEEATAGTIFINGQPLGFELKKVGLEERADHYPSQLSGGQQQRVAIARALALEPKIMLFDEPTSSLDPELTGEVLNVMRSLAEDGMTMVVVTHEIGFAATVGAKIAFLDQGKVLLEGPPQTVFGKPRHPRLDQFLDTYLDRGAAMLV